MYERTNPEPYVGPQISDATQGIAIIAIILAITAAFAFAPPRDPSKVIAGIPCSVLSETEIGAVMGTPMRLMPTTGNVCRYVATTSDVERTVMVVAHRVETPRPHSTYSVEVIEPVGQPQTAARERARLVVLIPRRSTLAQR